MKRISRLSLIAGMLFVSMPAWARLEQKADGQKSHKVNIGIKGGFNSSMYFTSHLQLGDQQISSTENWYKVGYWGAVFFRFNMHKHFIQPELTYNVSKGAILFDINSAQPDAPTQNANVNTILRSFDLPIFYGYNFIKKEVYGMSFFVGPKISYVWKENSKTDFTGFYRQNLSEEFYPLQYSAVVGLGVNISKIFFDFRYEIGLHNISKSITYTSQTGNGFVTKDDVTINRHKNVLSFSVGVMF